MDKRIRRNEICIIGLPACDYVFSSTRNCFISYEFGESELEKTILKSLLEARQINPIEAGGWVAPAQNVFCSKICSQIITSQFCIILANNKEVGGEEISNANVHMEYGLMLGFNKYIIPFQRASQRLPFNVAGLDTIKYSNGDFERKASEEIDRAIEATRQEIVPEFRPDQHIEAFLLTKNAFISACESADEKVIYQLGAPLGFNLLSDFSGMSCIFFGNFTALLPEVILWRLAKMNQILRERLGSVGKRIKVGIVKKEQIPAFVQLLKGLKIWLLVSNKDHRRLIIEALEKQKPLFSTEVFSSEDIVTSLKSQPGSSTK